MAIECLVCAYDRVNPSAETQDDLYRQGDFVVIKQSPAVWGTAEGMPDFWRITVEGIDLNDPAVEQWISERTSTELDPELGEVEVRLKRRDVHLDIAQLPPPVRNDILDDGLATVSVNRLPGFRDAITTRT